MRTGGGDSAAPVTIHSILINSTDQSLPLPPIILSSLLRCWPARAGIGRIELQHIQTDLCVSVGTERRGVNPAC